MVQELVCPCTILIVDLLIINSVLTQQSILKFFKKILAFIKTMCYNTLSNSEI